MSSPDLERVARAIQKSLLINLTDQDALHVARAAVSALMEPEPSYAMVRAASESRAKDDEGEFASLGDLLDFSGENKTHIVIRAAIQAMLRAVLGESE